MALSSAAAKPSALDTVNNFCINVNGNWPRCTSCHVGYGWRDASFDFAAEAKVDCLVCHEQTGTYRKFPEGAGRPASEPTLYGGELYGPPDWSGVAGSVGTPSLQNCGACHFHGGGGDAVKHGDLDSTMLTASRELDVHMSADGAGLRCQDCHIPVYARGQSTKVCWDWSQAGHRDAQGKPLKIAGPDGKTIDDGRKGAFRRERDLQPEFSWDDAIRPGMASVDVPYSGRHGFVETAYAYPVTHQVAPAERTTACNVCHVRTGSAELRPGLGEL